MRSTKDLKQMVVGSRAKSKMNGIAGKDYDTTQSTPDDEINQENKWDKKFGITSSGDDQKSDQAVINALTKELEDVKRKFA